MGVKKISNERMMNLNGGIFYDRYSGTWSYVPKKRMDENQAVNETRKFIEDNNLKKYKFSLIIA